MSEPTKVICFPSREFLVDLIAGYFAEFAAPTVKVEESLRAERGYALAAEGLAERILGKPPSGRWPGGAVDYLAAKYGNQCAALAPKAVAGG